MEKLFMAVAVLAASIFIATGAQALTVNDQEGVPGAYYGGPFTYTASGSQDPTYAHDINPGPSDPGSPNWSVTGFTATQVATTDGPSISVVFTGAYFASVYANPNNPNTAPGRPGDLYISSTGWGFTPSADGHATADTFKMSEGWNYVVSYGQGAPASNQPYGLFTYNATLYNLTSGQTPTSSGNGLFNEFRADQAWRGGYGTVVTTNAAVTLETVGTKANGYTPTLTFSFLNPLGWNPDQIGYHWTMGCGNDVVEGGGTPVPEPGSMLLLGLGFAGLGVCGRRVVRK